MTGKWRNFFAAHCVTFKGLPTFREDKRNQAEADLLLMVDDIHLPANPAD